jgi:hypothetical protein
MRLTMDEDCWKHSLWFAKAPAETEMTPYGIAAGPSVTSVSLQRESRFDTPNRRARRRETRRAVV